MRARGVPIPLLCLVALGLLSCRSPTQDEATEIPVSFLQDRVQEALDDLEESRTARDTAEAAARLRDASLKLRRLDEYYLPLLRARQQVERATRTVSARADVARSAVDSAEAVLLGISRAHGRHLEEEMREPLARLEEVRSALAAGEGEEAHRTLEELRHQLERMFFRGELVLQGSELDPNFRSNPD